MSLITQFLCSTRSDTQELVVICGLQYDMQNHIFAILYSNDIIFSITNTLCYTKAVSTLRGSLGVPHPSTNRAFLCLTSEFEWDPVCSAEHGRQQSKCFCCTVYHMILCYETLWLWLHVFEAVVVHLWETHSITNSLHIMSNHSQLTHNYTSNELPRSTCDLHTHMHLYTYTYIYIYIHIYIHMHWYITLCI